MSVERVCARERRLRPTVLVSALLLMLAPNLPVSAQAVGKAPVETAQAPSHVSRSADIIKAATVRRNRADEAIALSEWVRKNPGEVSDNDMSILAGLLTEDDDIVRREAAGALGFLGTRAKPFIPQLLAALKQRPCSDQPAMSADAIHVALERVGYGPMGLPCRDHERSPPQAR